MSKGGTNIVYISGPRGSFGIGYGFFYPEDLTADSEPNVDEFGPDNYWTAQTYIDWFAMNVDTYGVEVAKNKMMRAIDSWSGLGGVELDYCYQQTFVNFFWQYGIDVRTHACAAVIDLLDVVTDTTSTISTLTSILKIAIPSALVLGLFWIATSDEPKRYVKRKLRAA